MFGIFKRTKIKDEEIQLLKNVLRKLPIPYSNLINQIDDGLFRGVLINASDIPPAGASVSLVNAKLIGKV